MALPSLFTVPARILLVVEPDAKRHGLRIKQPLLQTGKDARLVALVADDARMEQPAPFRVPEQPQKPRLILIQPDPQTPHRPRPDKRCFGRRWVSGCVVARISNCDWTRCQRTGSITRSSGTGCTAQLSLPFGRIRTFLLTGSTILLVRLWTNSPT